MKGYLDIQEFLRGGGDLRTLYIGKLNASTVSSLQKFGVAMREPKYLPFYLQ